MAAVHENTPDGWFAAKPGFEEPHTHYLVIVSAWTHQISEVSPYTVP